MADVFDSNLGPIWEAAVTSWDYVTSALSSDDADEAQNSTKPVVSTRGTCTNYPTDGYKPVIPSPGPCYSNHTVSSNHKASSVWSDVKDWLAALDNSKAYWRK